MKKIIYISFLLILIASVAAVNAGDLNETVINDNSQGVIVQNDDAEILSLSDEDDLQGTWYDYEFHDCNISDAEAEFGQEDIELYLNSNFRRVDKIIMENETVIVEIADLLVGGGEWYEKYTGVKIYIDDQSVLNTTVVDGNNTLKVNLPPMINAGMHQIKAVLTKEIIRSVLTAYGSVPGGSEYMSYTMYSNLTVRSDIVLTMNDTTSKENHTARFQVNAKDLHDNNIRDLTFEFYKNDEYMGSAVSDANGNAKLDYWVAEDSKGTYNITAVLKNDRIFFDSNVSSTLIINDDIHTQINSTNLTMYFRGSNFTTQLKELNGTGISNQTVTLKVNGKNYTRLTDEEGFVCLPIRLNSGEYEIEITYLKSDNYLSSFAKNRIAVLPTISSDDLTKMYMDNETQFTAQFFDNKGNNLSNESVSFNINGVIYWHKTDSNGYSTLNINLLSGNYIITSFNSVTGEYRSNNITVKDSVKIISEDTVIYWGNDTPFKVNIKDEMYPWGRFEYINVSPGPGTTRINDYVDENATIMQIVTGRDNIRIKTYVENEKTPITISFNVNGTVYNRTGFVNHDILLGIDLNPGRYVVTTEYNGLKKSNNITVLSTLNATDLEKKYGGDEKFTARLVDSAGNPCAQKTVHFHVNGVDYEKSTNQNGIASLNINLMPGKYLIDTTCGNMTITNNITVTE